jgi:hypothetical protein
MWSETPDGQRWQLVWRDGIDVSPEMQQWLAGCQQQIAVRVAAEMAEALCRLMVAGAWEVFPALEDTPAVTYAVPSSGEGLTIEKIRRAREMLRCGARPEPIAYPLSGTGVYSQAVEREIPDTPYAEWCAGVEALLAECAAWEQQTDEVLKES